MKSKRKIVFLALLALVVWIPIHAWADGNDALFEQANASYSEGSFKEAIQAYEQILQTGQESSELYYNLGNAYFKTNQLSRALLNYERGLLLAPGDTDIQYNLKIANGLITDKIETLPEFFFSRWIDQLRSLIPANSWALLSILCFMIAGVSTVLFIAFRKRIWRKTSLSWGVLALVISMLSLSFAISQGRLLNERNTCIVFSPTVNIKSAPNESGTNLFVLHEGVKLQIIDRVSDWLEIKLPDGNMGWIPARAVEII